MYGDETRAKTVIYTALFAALTAVGGWISLPVFAVPFTLQSLFVILASCVMHKKAVYKNNTIEQIIREYGMCIGFSREKCERYRNGETLEQCGYGPNTTLYFSP